jgi:hypothetical protein
MKTAAITIGRAAVERLAGDRPSAAITYRALRSKADE